MDILQMVEAVQMSLTAYLMSAKFTFPWTLFVLMFAGYYVLKTLQHLDEDIEYATARIFLSPRSVFAMKVMMAVLVLYAILNAAAIVIFSGQFQRFLVRADVIMLFAGFAYYLKVTAEVTDKSS